MSTAPSDLEVLAGFPLPLRVRSNPRARRLILRLDERQGAFVLTVPRRTSRRAALAWAQGQADWASEQAAKLADPIPLIPGSTIPFEGHDRLLVHQAGGGREVTVTADAIRCGGPIESFPARIARFLRREARSRLAEETLRLAAAHGLAVGRISTGDAGSRWGSCSANGNIRYSWRLILAPPHVLRWVVAHEVAHLLHHHHGPAFKRAEAAFYDGDVAAARAELRRLGTRLKRVGGR